MNIALPVEVVMYRSSFGATDSEVWGNLLFKIVFVPFVCLLVALVAKQAASVRDYLSNSEPELPNSVEFVETTPL